MHDFTPLSAALGGLLIGLASAGILLIHQRIAGVSGIVAGLWSARPGDVAWRALFVVGLLVGGLGVAWFSPERFSMSGTPRLPWLVLAGVLTGFGARLGGGCTSGHGVCGIGRLSVRSIAATLTFMFTAAVVVYVVRHVLPAGAG